MVKDWKLEEISSIQCRKFINRNGNIPSKFLLLVFLYLKFCINVHEHLPNYSYIVRQTKGCFPAFYDHYVSASSFSHVYVAISADKGHSDSYPCDKCDLNFPNKADLKRHEISLHFGEKHKCCICGLKYSRKDSLSQHMQVVHFKANSSEFQCEGCKEMFSKKSHLVRHSSVPKTCLTCYQVFCSVKKLKQHKKSAHPSYSCEHFG